jgi:hypothetical protein
MADLLTGIDWAALGTAIPTEVFMWIKIALIVIAVYFTLLIIRNLIQIGAAWRMRKISKNVEQINKKMDLIINQPNNNYQDTPVEQYEYQQ